MSEKHTSNPLPELSEQDAELLSAYIDDMLRPIERAELESRLEDNVFLRDELIAMQQTVAWVNQLPRLKAPRNFTITAEDVQHSKSQEPPKKILRPNFAWTVAGSAAAIIVILFGIGAVLMQPSMGAAPAMEQQSIALQSTPAPDARSDDDVDSDNEEGNANAAGAAIEERIFIPTIIATPFSIPPQPVIIMGATIFVPTEPDENEADFADDIAFESEADNDVALDEEADGDESAVMNAPSDEAISPTMEASSRNVQTTQVANSQSIQLPAVAQTATSIALTFNATPTMSASQGTSASSGENDGTTAMAIGNADSGTGGNAPIAESEIESVPSAQSADIAEVGIADTSYLPLTGGVPNLENMGLVLLAWLITLLLEFMP